MDQFFAVIGVLFIVALVAQVFQKPDAHTGRRTIRSRKVVRPVEVHSRRTVTGARQRFPMPLPPLLRAGGRIYRWYRKPLTNGAVVTIGVVSTAVLVYLIEALVRPAAF